MQESFIDFPVFPIEPLQSVMERVRGEGAEKVLLLSAPAREEETDLEYASKIVSAVKLSLEKDLFLLFPTPGQNISLTPLLQSLGVKRVLVFGLEPAALGLQFRCSPYLPVRVGSTGYLFADSLEKLREERASGKKALASRLWQGLQAFFPGPDAS